MRKKEKKINNIRQMITAKKIFHLSSAMRESGNSSNFTVAINLIQQDNFDQVCLLQASIPKSYYTIRTGFNSFVVNNGTANTVYLPVGSYNRRALKETLESQLASFNISVSYTPGVSAADTGKFLFSAPGNVNLQFIFTENIFYALGFMPNSTNSFIFNPSSGNSELYSSTIIDVQLENAIFLRTDLISNNEGDNVLASILTSGEPNYANILYTCQDVEAYSRELSNSGNGLASFWLTDENGIAIDLNGLEITLTLLIYKRSNIYRKIDGLINLLTLKA